MGHNPEKLDGGFTPPYPALTALCLCLIWIVILSLPMWAGQFLAGPASDQYATGYAWRHWQAEQWKALGHIPLWNPDIFGGMPYVAGMHGDIFYPTAWLRLVFPTALAMNLGFVLHYVLAGFFAYILLRKLRISWTGSIVGGLAYQLSGVVASYVHPGHDGKLFVTALLPLALFALVHAIRDRRFEGYGILALAVGLALLSPHPQMAQYMLIAAGLFALYLTIGEHTDRTAREHAIDLSLALGAVLLGFGIGAIQLWPFYEYIPYSPRAETYRGWEGATSFAIPWAHVPELFFSKFAGQSAAGTYWGPNGIKLHSEYLGLPVIALAFLGAATQRRRLAIWLGGIGLLFLLVALGASTPFYRFWYIVVPFVKQTRAPGMALYIVALIISVFAGMGTERLEKGQGRPHAIAWLATAAAVILLAASGAIGGFAAFLAQGIEQSMRMPVAEVAANATSEIRWGAIFSGAALAAVAGLALGGLSGRIKVQVLCLGLVLIVSADLWRNAREFWVFSEGHLELHGSDDVTEHISATAKPYRVLNISDAYPGSSLQSRDIPQLLGHHGNELHRFDQLMGGKNEWRYVFSSRLGKILDLFAVQHVIVSPSLDLESAVPGFDQNYRRVFTEIETADGAEVNLFSSVAPMKYGRVVPTAVRLTDEEAINTILNPEFPPDQLMLLAPEANIDIQTPSELPPPMESSVSFESYEPGAIRMRLNPPPEQDAYVVVSENWYPDWSAWVDGSETQVVRGNMTLIAVPIPAGAQVVELRFDSADYAIGKTVTLICLLLVSMAVVVPYVVRRQTNA